MLVRRSNPVPPPVRVPEPTTPRLAVVRRLAPPKPLKPAAPSLPLGPSWVELEAAHVAKFNAIVAAVAFEMGLSADEIGEKSRIRRLSRARYAVAWLGAVVTGIPLSTMARCMGHRDHTTISYFRDRGVERRNGRDPAFKRLTDKLAERIDGGGL